MASGITGLSRGVDREIILARVLRYADDFVIGVQTKADAERILKDIRERFAKFGLTLAEDKTRVLEFGRFAEENISKRGGGKPQTFDFLGFTHYCGKTRRGRFAIKVKTSGKKHHASLKNLNLWLQSVRSKLPLPDICQLLKLKLKGRYNYYGVSGNSRGIRNFYYDTVRLAYKWTNRRSQKSSWNWETFTRYLKENPWPQPKLTYALYKSW